MRGLRWPAFVVNASGRLTRHVRAWRLWNLPRAAITWVVVTELIVLTAAAVLSAAAQVTTADLVRFSMLSACAVLHIVCTRANEERRRECRRNPEPVDQTGLWLCSGALILPVPLALCLLVVVRVQRSLVASRLAPVFTFTTIAIAAGILGAHTVSTATPLYAWLTTTLPNRPAPVAAAATAMAAAVAVYFLARTVLIGIVRGLASRRWAPVAILGDRTTNISVVTTLLLAVGVAVMQAWNPLATLLLVPVVVRAARVEHALRQAHVEGAELRHVALHDRLTGLPNRAGFEEYAQRALLDDQRRGRTTSLLFCDLDRFKDWNDRLGHDGADELLKAVADVLRKQTRQHDLLCRWGGEEMLALLRGADHDEAQVIAERIRATVATLRTITTRTASGSPIRLNSDGIPRCTISIGVAVAVQANTALDELRQRADSALLDAKSRGRDRVVLAPPPPCAPDSDDHDSTSAEVYT